MSRFLDIPNVVKNPLALHHEALFYVVPQLNLETQAFIGSSAFPRGNPNIEEKEFIQLMIDNSNHKLRMYGSAEELLENINIYKSFPANHKFFRTSDSPYQARPRIFTSLKNDEQYIAKSDLFVILQNMSLDLSEGSIQDFFLMLLIYLKSKQENIGKCTEFVKFDEKRFEEMYKRMEEEFQDNQISLVESQKVIIEFSKLDKTEIIDKFKGIMGTLSEEQYDVLESLLNSDVDSEEDRMLAAALAVSFYSDLKASVTVIESIIDKNPEMFLPRCKRSKEPITLRVFEDGDQQFLMKSEVSDALIANATLKKRLDNEDDEHRFHTITLEEVLKNLDTKNIEFIRYPILRAKHRATPIPRPTQKNPDETCILAIDAFKELIWNLNSSKNSSGI
ncbi:unnamed protein product [Caenorhabditis nigoni]